MGGGGGTIAHACDRAPARRLPRGSAYPWPVEPVQLDSGRTGRAGQDPAAGRGGPAQHRDRPAARLLPPDRDLVAAPLRPDRARRLARQAPPGPAPDRPRRPAGRDPLRPPHPPTPPPPGAALVRPGAAAAAG